MFVYDDYKFFGHNNIGGSMSPNAPRGYRRQVHANFYDAVTAKF